jgi:predicted nucleic-acid-binding protein
MIPPAYVGFKMYRKGNADFADYLILGTARTEALELRTFDKKLLTEIC